MVLKNAKTHSSLHWQIFSPTFLIVHASFSQFRTTRTGNACWQWRDLHRCWWILKVWPRSLISLGQQSLRRIESWEGRTLFCTGRYGHDGLFCGLRKNAASTGELSHMGRGASTMEYEHDCWLIYNYFLYVFIIFIILHNFHMCHLRIVFLLISMHNVVLSLTTTQLTSHHLLCIGFVSKVAVLVIIWWIVWVYSRLEYIMFILTNVSGVFYWRK